MSNNSDHFPKQSTPTTPLENKPKLEKHPEWAQTTRNPNEPEKKWS